MSKIDYTDPSCLENNLEKLEQDVSKVDSKLSDLDQLILDLKNNVNRANQMLANAAPADKVNLYKVINASMDMLNSYYTTYSKFLEIKLRYRSEHDTLSYKQTHLLQIELKKLDKKADASYADMIEVLKSFSVQNQQSNKLSVSLPDDIQANLQALDDDDIYSTK